MPLYSIITVCLNAEQRIEKTAQSIITQDESDYEWIVIDGGSSDGTLSLLKKYSLYLTHLLSEPDTGIYDAMNKGILLAKGEYFLFLNAGDSLCEKSVLTRMRKFLTANLVVGQIQMINPLSGVSDIRRYDLQDIRMKYLYSRSLPHPATFIHKSLFRDFGLYDTTFKIIGDYDFFVRVLNRASSLSFAPVCVSVFPLDGISFKQKQSAIAKAELKLLRRKNFSLTYRIWRLIIDSVEWWIYKFCSF